MTQAKRDMILIDIPRLPPSKNTYLGRHWATQHKIFNTWRKVMAFHPLRHTWQAIYGPVVVEIEFHLPNRRRVDAVPNMLGFPPLLDCLTPARVDLPGPGKRGRAKFGLGLIEDDCCTKCRVIAAEPVIDGAQRTIIRIWSISEQEGR